MILVTGASGSVGGAVAAELKNQGVAFKAMYRSEKDAGKAETGLTPVLADFSDKQSLVLAMESVETVFLVCSPIPQLVEFESNAIDAAVKAGVKHIVLNSALGAEDYPISFPSWHRQVEEHLKASGLGYTIFRPNGFMQNILAYNAPSIRSQSAFYAAMGDARTSFLDVGDIAAGGTKALVSPGDHAGKIYELNGPEAVTNAELAERISLVAGRKVQYVNIAEQAQRDSMLALGMPAWQVEAILDLQRYYTGGQGGEVTNVLPSLLGRTPKMLNRFLEEFKDSFRSEAE